MSNTTATEPRDYCQQYLDYCAEQGRTPEAQDKHDREQYPGGCMTGYILWSNAKARGE
jgi:hypothetical protein